jgi:microcystin-dependent protein
MAKLSRFFFNLFGSTGNTNNFYQFGSTNSLFPVASKDLPTIQNLQAWLDGLQDMVYGSGKYVILEEMNALLYVMAYQIAYRMQEGIPEWDASTTYYTGSIVKKSGTAQLYSSVVDNNLNNVLPNQTTNANWAYLNPSSNVPVGAVAEFGASAIPSGWLECDGSAVDRSIYANLFSAIGVTYGVGDGATTFNVPDLRGRVVIGAGQGSGLTNRIFATTIGEEAHVLTLGELPSHTHTVNDPGHSHPYAASADSGVAISGSEFAVLSAGNPGIHTTTSTTGVTFNNSDTGVAHNNMQPSLVVKKIIKY